MRLNVEATPSAEPDPFAACSCPRLQFFFHVKIRGSAACALSLYGRRMSLWIKREVNDFGGDRVRYIWAGP